MNYFVPVYIKRRVLASDWWSESK